jgi:hypothetical protein
LGELHSEKIARVQDKGAAMQLNDLLVAQGIDPSSVLVVRHRPQEMKLRKILPRLAAERPALFNAFQQAQFPNVEKAFTRAKYVASFIGTQPGKALFAGLYAVEKWRSITGEEFWRMPANKELHDQYGMLGFGGSRPSTLWFDLGLMDFYASWRGRLMIKWPGLERSWWRWASRNEFAVETISETSAFEPEIPKWDELVLSWSELKTLPKKWHPILKQWSGVYYIFDTSDGRGYVGSAYGADNLFGRWMHYAKSGHGGNKQLRGREPKNFIFSILRLLNHDADEDEVTRIETTWKERLHTRTHGLNDN